jgi:DNA end-binding protein Ku
MPRALWSGAISFGLVNIPIKMYGATRDRDVHFHMLHKKDGGRVHQRLYCPVDDREITRDEVIKGYEVSRNRYVTVTDKELRDIEPRATRAIEITDFVDAAQIDPVYFDRPYYLLPDERSTRPYALLAKAMKDAGKVAIGKMVMREKEYLAAIRPLDGVLLLETMRFVDEVVTTEEIGVPAVEKQPGKRELEMAAQLIDTLSGKFDPAKYHDEYREKVMDLVEKKAGGEEIEMPAAPAKPGKVIDLMAALEASLKQARGGDGKGRKKTAARKAASKKAPARRKAS